MEDSFNIANYRKTYQLPEEKVIHTAEFIPYKGFHLFFQMFKQPNEAELVLFLHGFFDHAGTHSEWIHYLTDQGYHVAAFDLPGHGKSGGPSIKRESFQEYKEALSTVLTHLKKTERAIIHGIGHSTGGAVLADYLLSYDDTVLQKVALVSPLIRSNQWWLSKMAAPIIAVFQKELPRTFRVHTGEASFMESIKQDPLEGRTIPVSWIYAMFQWEKELMEKTPSFKPVQILQGTEDQTLEWKHNMEAYHTLFPYSNRILIDNGRHHLLNERKAQREMIYRLIVNFLKNKENTAL
ncbi:alpha/beta hydrolase [Salibacterium aidingense]|uniref:alpha/beta hydrolase n=1 Tax=Salibacterium aidingense TaxID=384933 RepID=UPI0003F90801|nr:alpha/beta hydrolase [Salibacterium aidingense]